MAVSPYDTALVLNRPRPSYVPNTEDADRVTAYGTYEDIYNNAPEAFAVLLRDADDPRDRRYVPSGRTIVEATNRYLAVDFDWAADATGAEGATAEATEEFRVQVGATFEALMDREEFATRFMSMKRTFLVKGDGLFHVSASAAKPEGSRIRITEVEPDHYFPIYDPVDAERVVGCYLVTPIIVGDVTEPDTAQRLEYRRIMTEEDAATYGVPVGSVYTRLSFYAIDGWDDRLPLGPEDLETAEPPAWADAEPVQLQMAGFALPPAIATIPVYHFRNNRRASRRFGLSEMQGIETLMAGLTQTVSDEDVALALMGLGVYWTDSGRPRNERGEEVDWVIAPASMIELQKDGKLGRVVGIDTVKPSLDHGAVLTTGMRESTGTPDIAVGRVDVDVAESGVALAIKMAPILAKNSEKEIELLTKMNQMFFDIVNGWFPAYEGMEPRGVSITPSFGNPLPKNRKERIEEVVRLVEAKIISLEYARQLLTQELGMEFPAGLTEQVAAEAQMMVDAMGARIESEAGV